MTKFERDCLNNLLFMLENEISAGDTSSIDAEIWDRMSEEKKSNIKKNIKLLSMIIK